MGIVVVCCGAFVNDMGTASGTVGGDTGRDETCCAMMGTAVAAGGGGVPTPTPRSGAGIGSDNDDGNESCTGV